MTGSVSWGIFAGMIPFEGSLRLIFILGPLFSHIQYASHHHASRVQTHFIVSQKQIWKTSWLPKYHVVLPPAQLPRRRFSVPRFSGAPLGPKEEVPTKWGSGIWGSFPYLLGRALFLAGSACSLS